ncbi:MAG: putative toxin-antitoxin system toxin component, PIN family [Alphaproteobacteria bacterium]|nr:putative toxin-antitoxin system toxin component, PIN family [Alphaproteobacteria bacterium]
MRIVIDTNIFVSAALKDKSIPAIALHRALRTATLLKSSATDRQLLDVLSRPSLLPFLAPTTIQWIEYQLSIAETVSITSTIIACRDPTDNKFLELAVDGKADLILSGDKDLLILNPFDATPILSPAIFIQGIK